MSPNLLTSVVVLKPPVLNADRFEERLDRELVVRVARDRLTHQCGMSQGVGRIAAGGSWGESQLRGSFIAAEAEDIFPRPVVGRASGLWTNARGVIEQLPDGDLFLEWIAEGLRPRNELKGRIIERHLPFAFQTA